MARDGMANPILKLRELTNAGTADYALAGVTYWSDNQLQSMLDRCRTDIFSERLEVVPTITGGTTHYYDYYATPREYEQGTAVFQVTDSLGNAVAPTINYEMGHLSFGGVDQGGTVYYLTARAFDLNAAAAQVWRSKAAHVADAYDFSADGHSMSRSQMVKHYREMAQLYAGQAQPTAVRMQRSDE